MKMGIKPTLKKLYSVLIVSAMVVGQIPLYGGNASGGVDEYVKVTYGVEGQSLLDSYTDGYGQDPVKSGDLALTGNAAAIIQYERLFDDPDNPVYECSPEWIAEEGYEEDFRVFCKGNDEEARFLFLLMNGEEEKRQVRVEIDPYQSQWITVNGFDPDNIGKASPSNSTRTRSASPSNSTGAPEASTPSNGDGAEEFKDYVLDTVLMGDGYDCNARMLVVPASKLMSQGKDMSLKRTDPVTVHNFDELKQAIDFENELIEIDGDIVFTQSIAIDHPVEIMSPTGSTLEFPIDGNGGISMFFIVNSDLVLDGVNMKTGNLTSLPMGMEKGASLRIISGIYEVNQYVVSGNGNVILQGGSFTSSGWGDDRTPRMFNVDAVEFAYGSMPDTENWREARSFSVVPLSDRKVSYYIGTDLIHSAVLKNCELLGELPEALGDPDGGEFTGWYTADGKKAVEGMNIEKDTQFQAVYTTDHIQLTFTDNDQETVCSVAYGTLFSDVEQFGNHGQGFAGWQDKETSKLIQAGDKITRPYILNAVYAGVTVSTYDELQEALYNKEAVIEISGIIEVQDTIYCEYDMTLLGDGAGSGFYRPDVFSEMMVSIEAGAKVTMRGITIDGKRDVSATTGNMAVYVNSNAELKLYETVIQNNYSQYSGGGIKNDGVLYLYDGTVIKNNLSTDGGGIYNGNNNSGENNIIYMYGGEISNNVATNSNGGGIGGRGSLYLYNGIIKGNRSKINGGGVYLHNNDNSNAFHMYGGEITDNEAGSFGGGISTAYMEMNGGLIGRNYAEIGGGGIYSDASIDKPGQFCMNGGLIILNCSEVGEGGIGGYWSVEFNGGGIYDNLTGERGDDLGQRGEAIYLTAEQPYRIYGESYVSDKPLSQYMEDLKEKALPTLNVPLIPGAPEPEGVEIPFYGWYYDLAGIAPNFLSLEPPYDQRYAGLDSPKLPKRSGITIPWENKYYTFKAIWFGYLFLYEANDQSGRLLYDTKAYLPGEEVTVAGNMFSNDKYTFIGWNTNPDGSGTWYNPDEEGNYTITMNGNMRLYAQWKENPDNPDDPNNPDNPNQPDKPSKPGHSGGDGGSTTPNPVPTPTAPEPTAPEESYTGIGPDGIPFGTMAPDGTNENLPKMGEECSYGFMFLFLAAGLLMCRWKLTGRKKGMRFRQ